jgi:hypothetical protein
MLHNGDVGVHKSSRRRVLVRFGHVASLIVCVSLSVILERCGSVTSRALCLRRSANARERASPSEGMMAVLGSPDIGF